MNAMRNALTRMLSRHLAVAYAMILRVHVWSGGKILCVSQRISLRRK